MENLENIDPNNKENIPVNINYNPVTIKFESEHDDKLNAISMTLTLNNDQYSKIQENLFKALQKIGSSFKTRLIHPIIEKKLFKISNTLTDTINHNIVHSTSTIKNGKFLGIYIDINAALDIEDRKELVTVISISQEIDKLKIRITDGNDQKIASLIKNRDDILKNIINNIDYLKLIDIMYFEVLTRMVIFAKSKKHIYKILEKVSHILGIILNGIIRKFGDVKDRTELGSQIMLMYLFSHYSHDNDASIRKFFINNNLLDKNAPGNIKFKTIEDISKYLTTNNILNISPNALRNNLQYYIGSEGLDFLEDKYVEKLVAYLIINQKPNQLFSLNIINKMLQEDLKQLDLLVMNLKSEITF